MVDLVLQQLGERALGFDGVFLPAPVEVGDFDAVGSLHLDHQIGEREARVPHKEILGSDIYDLRVDQQPRLVDLDVDHPHGGPDLRSGQASSLSVASLQVLQGVPQIGGDQSRGGRPGVGHRFRPHAQNGVTQQSDSVYCHFSGFPPVLGGPPI